MSIILRTISTPLNYPKFTTHRNYVAYMAERSQGLGLFCGNNIRARMNVPDSVKKKIQLVKATLKNLQMEANIVNQHPEYAEVAVSWIPVKSYYLIFNLISLLETLVSTDQGFLAASHSGVLEQFRTLLGNGSLRFTEAVFNEIKTGREIEAMQVPRAENLRTADGARKEQIFRKLIDYSKQEMRRRAGVSRLGRAQMARLRNEQFVLFDLFYWYRIKVNYRDLEFMEEEVPTHEFREFHNNYYILTKNFYNALKQCLDEVAIIRTGSVLF